MFKTVWNWLRKLPVAKWIRPIWKGALRETVKMGFTWLRVEAARLEGKAPGEFRALITQWSIKCKGWVKGSPLPDTFEDKVCAWIDTEAAILGKNVDAVGANDSALTAFNAAINTAENVLLSRIEQL